MYCISHPAPFGGGGGEKYPILMCKITDTSQRRSHKFIQNRHYLVTLKMKINDSIFIVHTIFLKDKTTTIQQSLHYIQHWFRLISIDLYLSLLDNSVTRRTAVSGAPVSCPHNVVLYCARKIYLRRGAFEVTYYIWVLLTNVECKT